jgi:hypothetical protein
MRIADRCESCGRVAENLTLIGSNWYCRGCLWEKFYDMDHAVNYCIINMDKFCERYPEGYYWLLNLLKTGEDQGEDHVEEFVSENLADYADWVIGNPVIITMQDIRRGKDNG